MSLKTKHITELDKLEALSDSTTMVVEDSGEVKRVDFSKLRETYPEVPEVPEVTWETLPDKPFYDNTAKVFEHTYEGGSGITSMTCEDFGSDTRDVPFTVVLDGVSYTGCFEEGTDVYGGKVVWLGNGSYAGDGLTDNNMPFAIYCDDTELRVSLFVDEAVDHTIEVYKTDLKPLDPKYLPEHEHPLPEGYPYEETVEVVGDSGTITFDSDKDTRYYNFEIDSPSVGDVVKIIWDGVEYNETVYEANGSPAIGSDWYMGSDSTDPPFFMMFDFNDIRGLAGEHTFEIYVKKTVAHKLDDKFLPDTVPATEDIPGVELHRESMVSGGYLYETAFVLAINWFHDENSNLYVYCDGEYLKVTDAAGGYSSTDACYIYKITTEGRTFTYNENNVSSYDGELELVQIRALDEKALPDSIARKEDIPEIPEHTWETLPDKPFYEEMVEVVHVGEQTVSIVHTYDDFNYVDVYDGYVELKETIPTYNSTDIFDEPVTLYVTIGDVTETVTNENIYAKLYFPEYTVSLHWGYDTSDEHEGQVRVELSAPSDAEDWTAPESIDIKIASYSCNVVPVDCKFMPDGYPSEVTVRESIVDPVEVELSFSNSGNTNRTKSGAFEPKFNFYTNDLGALTVVFDGVEYPSLARNELYDEGYNHGYAYGNLGFFAETDTGEPFVLYVTTKSGTAEPVCYVYSDTETVSTIGVYVDATTITPIDEKFLPESVKGGSVTVAAAVCVVNDAETIDLTKSVLVPTYSEMLSKLQAGEPVIVTLTRMNEIDGVTQIYCYTSESVVWNSSDDASIVAEFNNGSYMVNWYSDGTMDFTQN